MVLSIRSMRLENVAWMILHTSSSKLRQAFLSLSDSSVRQSLSRHLVMLGTVVCLRDHVHLRLTRCKTSASCVLIFAIVFHLGLVYFQAMLILAHISAGARSFRSPLGVCCCCYSCVCPIRNLIHPHPLSGSPGGIY